MLPRHLTLDHGLPKDAGFYTSSDLVIDAKLHALSYTSNPRNLEAPFYGLHNTTLSELFDRHLITHPQYVLYTSKHEAHSIIKLLNDEALAKEAATSSEGSAGSDSDTTSSEPSSSSQHFATDPASTPPLSESVPSEDGHSHSDEADESAGVVGPMGDVAEAAGSVAEDGGSIAEVAGSVVEDRESIDSAENRISDDGSVADAESSIVEYGGGVVDTAGSVAGDSGRAVDAEGNTVEAGDYDADRMSIASMHTVSVPEALSGVPDFAGIFSIVIDMEGGPTQVPPSRRNQPEPEAESETQARKRRAAQACSLYDGEYLLWERVIFLEEDKHNPGRGAHWSPGPNLDDPQINKLLQEAQKDLIDYLFILFYLVDKNAKTVVVRATAGVFWCWACINREDVPLYTMPTPNSDLRQSLTLSERAKADALIGKWSETFVVGRLNSDAELTKMRKKVFEVIGNDAPVALVRKRLVTRDQMENM
ncbi:hypothetical protein EV714DRAFT_276500 [Schizophyllum commune]